MKEIKFRAWHKKNKAYYEVVSIDFVNRNVILKHFLKVSRLLSNVLVSFEDIILEQYTGLSDNNNIETYEGDIVVKKWKNEDCYYGSGYTVEFSVERQGFYPFAKGDGCGCCENDTISNVDFEIVGNIHEGVMKKITHQEAEIDVNVLINKDLLEEDKKAIGKHLLEYIKQQEKQEKLSESYKKLVGDEND